MFNSTGDVAVVRVEVPMGEAITHPGNVSPGAARLSVEELWRDGLDGLTDLDESDADSIEDEAVRKPPAGHMAPDGVDGI